MFWKITQGTYLANTIFSVIWAKCMFQPASGDGACSQSQAASLHAQEVARGGRVKLERAGPTWPCIMLEPKECFRRALKLRWGWRPTGSVVSQKQTKNSVEHSRSKPARYSHASLPYTSQTMMEFSVHWSFDPPLCAPSIFCVSPGNRRDSQVTAGWLVRTSLPRH